MPSVRAALIAVAAALVLIDAAPAAAQTPTPTASATTAPQEERGKALIVLDGSKSMNEDAGDGGTRLDAAKAATLELLDAIPEGTDLGLRIYGSRLAGVSRERACSDTRLAFPVGPTDRSDLRSTVEGLEGVGRTPIGRSLLATPDDLGPDGRRVVVLISDGGDNCAPPDPCDAAREVSRRGLDLTVSVVGLQVSSDRVRRQLQCIAEAGGGTYVEAQDADELAQQLQALFLRGLRTYQPEGEPVQGAADPAQAPVIAPGRYLDTMDAGQKKYYALDVPAGNRTVVASTYVSSVDAEGGGGVEANLFSPGGEKVAFSAEALSVSGGFDRVQTPAFTSAQAGSADFAPGRYVVELNNDSSLSDVPVELAVDVAPERDPVDFAGEPFRPPGSDGGGSSSGGGGGGDDGGGLPLVLGAGGVGLLLGLVIALTLVPRRRA